MWQTRVKSWKVLFVIGFQKGRSGVFGAVWYVGTSVLGSVSCGSCCLCSVGSLAAAGGGGGGGGVYVAWKGCSPFHPEPCFSGPVGFLDDPLLLPLVEVLICFFNNFGVVVWLLYDCPSVVLQPFCWNWTVVVWHEECFALCSVDSDQEALAVECPQVVPVPQDLHACWCQCH